MGSFRKKCASSDVFSEKGVPASQFLVSHLRSANFTHPRLVGDGFVRGVFRLSIQWPVGSFVEFLTFVRTVRRGGVSTRMKHSAACISFRLFSNSVDSEDFDRTSRRWVRSESLRVGLEPAHPLQINFGFVR